MGEVIGFAFTAAANPTLIAVTTVILLLPNPPRLMRGYLFGAWLMSFTLGLVIVFAAENSSLVESGKHTIAPAIDLALGGLLILVALVVHSGRHQAAREERAERKARKREAKVPRWQRVLGDGDPKLAFVVGVVVAFPGVSYLAALDRLSKLQYDAAATVLVLLLMNVIMLAVIELPLLSFAIAPNATPATIERVKAWFKANGRAVLAGGAAIVGSLLILRGVIELVA